MSLHRLDAGNSTLVADCRHGRFQICYFGARLPQNLRLEEISFLNKASTPHGELDCEHLIEGFPTKDGHRQSQAALLARRNGQALLVDLSVIRCKKEAHSLELHLEDSLANISVNLSIQGFASGVFSSRSTVTNCSDDSSLEIDWLASLHLPLPSSHTEVERYGGFWANEFLCERVPLGQYSFEISSHRGRSSHQSFPTLLCGAKGFSQEQKQALLLTLKWSGNHRLRIEPSPAGGHSVQAGVALQGGELCLSPGQQWRSPAALFAQSEHGVNGLRHQFLKYWYTQMPPATWRSRAVHFNSWESTYFSHDAASSCKLIDKARGLGAERFVLDDGWMEGRVDIGCGLGDWIPCRSRYPQGLNPIALHARKSGMSFGLWIEPEMVTLDSLVARTHADWIISIPERDTVSGRQQYLLNLCLPAARQHILQCIDRLIEDCEPDYLKWDMNRDHAQVGFGNRSTPLAMTRAWYALIDEIRIKHPNVAIESCAAGGARSDAGALARSHRIWPSDSMDPLQRFKIMKHISCVLPPALLGTHVGTSPSSTSGAMLPLSTRCIIALLGHMGLELNPEELSQTECSTVLRWTTFFKAQRNSLAASEFHYLDTQEPGVESLFTWDANKASGLLFVLRSAYPLNAQPPILRLPALVSGKRFDLQLLNPEDADFVQHGIDWHHSGICSVSGDSLHLSGLRAPFVRYGHCALIRLSARPG